MHASEGFAESRALTAGQSRVGNCVDPLDLDAVIRQIVRSGTLVLVAVLASWFSAPGPSEGHTDSCCIKTLVRPRIRGPVFAATSQSERIAAVNNRRTASMAFQAAEIRRGLSLQYLIGVIFTLVSDYRISDSSICRIQLEAARSDRPCSSRDAITRPPQRPSFSRAPTSNLVDSSHASSARMSTNPSKRPVSGHSEAATRCACWSDCPSRYPPCLVPRTRKQHVTG